MDVSYGNEPSLAYEEPPPYSPVRTSNDVFIDKMKEDGIVVRIARTWTPRATTNGAPKRFTRTAVEFFSKRAWPAIRDMTTTHAVPAISSSSSNTWKFVQEWLWKPLRDYPLKGTQVWALLLLGLGVVPFVVYGIINVGRAGRFYYGAFSAKTLGCGDALGVPQNSTVEGVEALFVLDVTFGQFTFARVKTIDVAWDILVGRGVQMIFWAISYRVFSDALLRLIERHPASFKTFRSISLEGPGLGSSWILLKQLFRNRSMRTWFLFFYLLLASFYVMSIPPLLGAMTGYDGTSIAWVSIGDADNIIPYSQIEQSVAVYGTWNQTFDEPVCEQKTSEIQDWPYHRQDLQMYCNCRLPNGTILPFADWQYKYNSYLWIGAKDKTPYDLDDCKIRYEGQNGTFQSTWGQDSLYPPAKDWGRFSCNDSFPVTLANGRTYSIYDLNFTTAGFCFQNKSYNYMDLMGSTRCLPDTAHPSYQWGFSSAMMGVIFIINLVWCLTMWIVWQDALRATLVRGGYRMSPLRAAFILTEAARRRTGVGIEGLILREKKTLRKELNRNKNKGETTIDKDVFGEACEDVGKEFEEENSWTIKRRPVRNKNSDSLESV